MLGVVIAGYMFQAPFLLAGAIALGSMWLMRGVGRGAVDIGKPLSFLTTLATLKNDRTLVIFTAGCLLSTIVHGRFTLYLSQYLMVTQEPRQALDTMAALLACNALCVIALQYQIGRFLKREQLRYWIALGTALFMAGLIGFSVADNLLLWCLAMLVFTLGR